MTYSQQTIMVPARTNHVLHLILTLISCGFWAPVWGIVALYNYKRTVPQTAYGVSTQAVPADRYRPTVWQEPERHQAWAHPIDQYGAPMNPVQES